MVWFQGTFRILENGFDLGMKGVVDEPEKSKVFQLLVVYGNPVVFLGNVVFGVGDQHHLRSQGPLFRIFPRHEERLEVVLLGLVYTDVHLVESAEKHQGQRKS